MQPTAFTWARTTRSTAEARRLMGQDALIGRSTHSVQEIEAAGDVDYIAVGPVHRTPTKPEYEPVGLELVREAAERATVPFFAIGGIDAGNVDRGARGRRRPHSRRARDPRRRGPGRGCRTAAGAHRRPSGRRLDAWMTDSAPWSAGVIRARLTAAMAGREKRKRRRKGRGTRPPQPAAAAPAPAAARGAAQVARTTSRASDSSRCEDGRATARRHDRGADRRRARHHHDRAVRVRRRHRRHPVQRLQHRLLRRRDAGDGLGDVERALLGGAGIPGPAGAADRGLVAAAPEGGERPLRAGRRARDRRSPGRCSGSW